MKGGHLYTRLKEFLKAHLASIRLQSESFNENEQLLKYYTEQWERYSVASKFVHRLFSYLNRYWVTREIDENHRNVYDIYTVKEFGFGRGVETFAFPRISDGMVVILLCHPPPLLPLLAKKNLLKYSLIYSPILLCTFFYFS